MKKIVFGFSNTLWFSVAVSIFLLLVNYTGKIELTMLQVFLPILIVLGMGVAVALFFGIVVMAVMFFNEHQSEENSEQLNNEN